MVCFKVELHLFSEKCVQNQECTIANLTKSLESCDVKVLQCDVQTKNIGNVARWGENHNAGLFLQLEFLLDDENNENLQDAYKALCNCWVQSSFEEYSVKFYPWLVIKNSTVLFNQYKSAHTEINLTFSMCTLLYPSSYVNHSNLWNSSGNFFHDTRKLMLHVGDMFLEIGYSSIRNVIVSRKNGNMVVLFHLIHPPLAYLKDDVPKRTNSFMNVDSEKLGKSNSVLLSFLNESEAENIISRIHHRCGKLPIGYVPLVELPSCNNYTTIPNIRMKCYDCVYILHALVLKNYVLQLQGFDKFLTALKHCHQEDDQVTHTALNDLFRLFEKDALVDYTEKLQFLYCFNAGMKSESEENDEIVPTETLFVRRAVITPTKTLLWPPELIMHNRVLRKFNPEYSLRVSFRDDDYQHLNMLFSYDKALFKCAIQRPLNEGIRIGSRFYRFLGWSNSQLRSHSVWMYAKDDQGNDVSSIHHWMGDFSKIFTIPKRMSRMGQCFSHTQDIMEVPLNEASVETADDIEDGYNPESKGPYCFSDGIGKISSSFATKVCQKMELEPIRSAYQIRCAGYKGMLVFDPTLTDVDIMFRKSMQKFECEQSHRLEVVKVSQVELLYLNRPLINILNQMGVPDHFFLRIQEIFLQDLIGMFLDGKRAADYLSMRTSISSVDFFELFESGIDLTTEPFFKGLLLALHQKHIRRIKNKAFLQVPPNYGRNMFGVLDETGKLNPNEVFVQYTVHQFGKCEIETQICKGDVLVSRSPSLSAGDVRKLKAVDIEELHHIVDCVVFPQKGQRPHPNEMSGGDLDGDEYAVIWHKDLIFPGEHYRPQQFPVPEHPKRYECGENMKMLDAIYFLCDYIRNDKLGIIASSHLAISDYKRHGIFDAACTYVARIFSLAVDFAKNGQSVKLGPRDRPVEYPDFMQNRRHKSYRSRRALGKLFRNARDFEHIAFLSSKQKQDTMHIDDLLEVQGWECYKEEAVNSRNKYNKYLTSLMQTYGVHDEKEIISGAFSNLHYRHFSEKDQNEIEELLVVCVKHLWQLTRKDFFSGIDLNGDPDELLKKASAWYMVTYTDPNADILSFPWVASSQLASIKLRRLCGMNLWPITVNASIENLENKLKLNINKLQDLKSRVFNILAYPHVEVVLVVAKMLISWGKENFLKPFCPSKYYMLDMDIIRLFSWFIQKETSRLELAPVALFIEFLKLCVSFRFQTKSAVNKTLSFRFPQCKNLGRHAMYCYHHIAVTGTLDCLGLEHSYSDESKVELEPFLLQQDLIQQPVGMIRHLLRDWSDVESVELRKDEQSGGYYVSAFGTPATVGNLEHILQKGTKWLCNAFKNGFMNEDFVVPT